MKNYLITIALGFLAFACSEDTESTLQENKEVTINLSMIGDIQENPTTRRPIYSQEGLQAVEKMNLYVFNQSGSDYTYYSTYSIPWTKGNSTGNYTLPTLLPTGNYKFLIVGRELSDDYTLSALVPTTKFDDFSANIDHSSGKKENEIFSGSQAISITSVGARASITTTRQVAGLLGYIKNVPKTVNSTPVRYLRLNMTNAGSTVNLTTAAGSNPTANYLVYEVDLSTQATNDSVFLGNTIPQVVKLDFTQLNGAYLIPTSNVTMTLGLYDASNNLLKAWPVKSAGATTFNIIANRFYSLGRKLVAASTDGGTPGNPNNNDYAIDLLGDLEIAITINPNWDVIYTLPLQ